MPEWSPLGLLPVELKLYILSFLDVEAILLMRLTCIALAQITRSRTLWLALLHKSQDILPYSSHVRSLAKQNYSSCLNPLPFIESAVIHACRSTRTWPRQRMRQPIQLHKQNSDSRSLLFMELYLDRWLLYAYTEGQVYLWDINPSNLPLDGRGLAPRQCASLDLGSRNWTSLAASLDASNECIIIALTRASIPSSIQIYRIQMRHDPDAVLDSTTFELLHTLVSPIPQLVRMIQPSTQLMILSSPSTVDIVAVNTRINAPVDVSGEVVDTKLNISPDNLEELVVDVRIIETYVVVFKMRSIKIYPLMFDMTSNKEASRCQCTVDYGVRDDFPITSLCFRSVSISEFIVDQGIISFSFCGYDFLRGIFRFEARIFPSQVSNSRSEHGPFLDLNCVGIYPISDVIDKNHLQLLATRDLPSTLHASDASSSNTNSTPNISPKVRSNMDHISVGANSRGFVSAMSLGPQGKRAVWVERRRSSTIREVFVWQKGVEDEVVIPRQAVYRVESYDLKDDLTHCAIGEVSGTIVLGNRAGEIFILGIDL
ncbi:hypothetical protein H2248_010418 [Termitomyces sp. 'cryptogamus']|nr:hypothetical protein H2248_010418 [Termitomyces sp. 'cryptogamus']